MTAVFRGCGVAIATPFNEDGSVDFDAYRDLINWQIEKGIDAIIACGTSGEASTMDDEEHVATVKFCVDTVAGRVPVIGGAGSNDTRPVSYTHLDVYKRQEHDDIHIDAHYISLKSGKSYHILCWNTHPFRTDDIVLKLSADLIGSPIFINTLSLKDYDGYLEKMKRLCQSGYDKNILPEATTKAIEQKIFSESRTLTVSEPFSLSLHIQCETLCFISILPLE